MRAEGQPAHRRLAVTEAYDGLGNTYDYYWATFQRDSIDGQGQTLHGCVHFGTDYPNAFWDGHAMFFGDGDGQVLTRTTAGIDVIGHELTHGVTQYEANLVYSGQSGRSTSRSPTCSASRSSSGRSARTSTTSDWLIGADIVGPGAAAGAAVDEGAGDRRTRTTTSRPTWTATSTAATCTPTPASRTTRSTWWPRTLGGNAWDAAGPIWYATLRDARLTPTATFQEFARLTVRNASMVYGAQSPRPTRCGRPGTR